MDENLIIEEIRSGNEEVLAQVYKTYRVEFILWAAKTYKCTLDEAKDVYQTAILDFYENIRNGKITHLRSSVKTYLFAIGKNKAMEEKRSGNKFIREEQGDYNLIDTTSATKEMEELHEYNLKLIEQCLQKLGDPCKSILEQYYYHKKSMRDITSKLGYKNADTLKNLKYKCMNRLKKLVEEESSKINKLSNG